MAKKKPTKKSKKRSPKKKSAPKPDVNQIAARILNSATAKN
jgi:hypothetical protein